VDLSDFDVVAVNLTERRIEYPPVSAGGPGGSTVGMTQSNSDVLLLGSRRAVDVRP
jgi:hypothetical protein